MSKELTASKIELLNMAREQLVKEYLEKRVEDHSQWINDADDAWRSKGVWLAYPPMPAYPSQADILLKATELSKIIGADTIEEPVIETLAPTTSDNIQEPT
jgi:hypothetical protein